MVEVSNVDQWCLRFLEENHEYKINSRMNEGQGKPRRGPPLEVMQFWGKKMQLKKLDLLPYWYSN